MPSPFVALPVPIVPFVPGVPALFAVGAALANPILAIADSFLGSSVSQRWGIFANGAPILEADAVAYVEYAQDYRISDYPQEQGAFESYNKVQIPYQAKVGFLVNQSREAFLQAIGSQLASLQFVQVVTPEITYSSANLTHYSYRRTVRGGVTLILVDVWCEEIRVTATTQLSSTASQNGQQPVDAGSVQPSDTTTTPTNQITGAPSTLVSPSTAAINPSGSGLTTPNIGPAFYDSTNLPEVPNGAAQFTGQQIGSTLTFGQAFQAGGSAPTQVFSIGQEAGATIQGNVLASYPQAF